MTKSYYKFIDTGTLLKDRKLIIFAESITYCRENGQDYVRYLQLKRLCNDRLINLTGGRETDFGGNFEVIINKITDELNPKEQYMVRAKISNRVTKLYPNIPLMFSYLDKKRVNPAPSGNYDLAFREIKEMPIIIEEKLVAKVKRAGQSEFMSLS